MTIIHVISDWSIKKYEKKRNTSSKIDHVSHNNGMSAESATMRHRRKVHRCSYIYYGRAELSVRIPVCIIATAEAVAVPTRVTTSRAWLMRARLLPQIASNYWPLLFSRHTHAACSRRPCHFSLYIYVHASSSRSSILLLGAYMAFVLSCGAEASFFARIHRNDINKIVFE